ncbi:anthranilate phosphoribosyltransferase [Hyphomicrobium methylovorum]|uniref:anthranilate phosphoribosyltransferase n=1 Tax=Hyphomicrobium methylovorum TaxID=84 RepID=UPI0015E6F1F0|nr:anthranilate phosphoribosyltransferase [Hyphomicrobium methylovorum]MBA2127685.1 anthranilate phosphoribosyltransferase [Hyphomicrobium methylovorum]
MNRIADGETLGEDGMQSALDLLMSGIAPPVAMGAFLMGMRVRGETTEEITGAARFVRSRMTTVDAPPGAIDIVGTGGDSRGTYNVSTCAAIVAAGAGAIIAKHGNRAVTSLSGASDVLAALGVKLDVPPVVVSRAIAEAGVGFLWAPLYHPAFKTWAPIRADLGLRTILNLLGPLCNPAGVKRQVLGVYDRKLVQPIAEVLRKLGSEHAWVVHGADGMDELTTTGVTHIAELKNGDLYAFDLTPEDTGIKRSDIADLKGGDAATNAAAIHTLLQGEPSAYRDIVVLNAAAALVVAGTADSLADGMKRAADAIDSGRAARALDRLVAVTNDEA